MGIKRAREGEVRRSKRERELVVTEQGSGGYIEERRRSREGARARQKQGAEVAVELVGGDGGLGTSGHLGKGCVGYAPGA